jgi:hypothetical protein
LRDDVSEIFTPIFVELRLVFLYFNVKLMMMLRNERRNSINQLVYYRTEAPPIDSLAMPLLLYNLRSQILRCSTDRMRYEITLNVVAG